MISPFPTSAPLPITMWDFSWLERRWPGAGYEDWDRALDDLAERGYQAVRIDAYPHLIAADSDREWELLPEWSNNDWGAPARVRVRPWPALATFITKCAERKIRVGLSTWFREDTHAQRLAIPTPEAHARIWADTLNLLRAEGLQDTLLYVDLCNEWPQQVWAPFFRNDPGENCFSGPSLEWMQRAVAALRPHAGGLPLTFSFANLPPGWRQQTLPFLDFLEPHIWMTGCSDFYQRVNYNYERFDPSGYERLVRLAEPLYRSDPAHWQAALRRGIADAATWSRQADRALVTTECWGLVDFKDWPGLDWGYVRELCEIGVTSALETGRWAALATSNFCGPQFCGMWRDLAWHQQLTNAIRTAKWDGTPG